MGENFGMMKRYWKRVRKRERENVWVRERWKEKKGENGSLVERDEFEDEFIDFYG